MVSNIFSFFRFIGGSFCHQLAERSFIIGGNTLPVCARCTGIMIGIFSGICFIYLFKRYGGNRPFGIITLILMLLGYLFLGFDGLTSYIGLRESNNISRLISGVLAGYIFPMFFTLIRNFDENSRNDIKIMGVFDIVIIIFGATLLSSLIYIDSTVSWFILSTIISFSAIYFFANIYALILRLTKNIKGSLQKKSLVIISFALACATIIIFSNLNNIISK